MGIDPGLRHTGLACYRAGQPGDLAQIDTKGDVVSSLAVLRQGFRQWLRRVAIPRSRNDRLVYGFERQLPGAAVNGWLLMIVQNALFEEIGAIAEEHGRPPRMAAPYPNQLSSYTRRVFGAKTDAQLRLACAEQCGLPVKPARKRPSIHRADAYFAARFACAVHRGEWKYTQGTVKPAVAPWDFMYGS